MSWLCRSGGAGREEPVLDPSVVACCLVAVVDMPVGVQQQMLGARSSW